MSLVDAERTKKACCPERSDTEYRYAECQGDENFRLLTPPQPRSAISAGAYCLFFCLSMGTIRRHGILYNDIQHSDTLRNDAQPKSIHLNIKHYIILRAVMLNVIR